MNAKMLQDNNGNTSSMRFALVLWVVVPIVVWAILSITKGAMLDIPMTVGGIITAILTAKVFQKSIEVNAAPEQKP